MIHESPAFSSQQDYIFHRTERTHFSPTVIHMLTFTNMYIQREGLFHRSLRGEGEGGVTGKGVPRGNSVNHPAGGRGGGEAHCVQISESERERAV